MITKSVNLFQDKTTITMKNILIIILLFSLKMSGQDSKVFERITSELSNYKVDTTAVPEDKLTRKIRKLREIKGSFNINEAILFKIGEEKEKGEMTLAEANALSTYLTSGKGAKLLDNAVVHIYRNMFTSKELNKIIKFYGSKVGTKFSQQFPILIVESLKAAETIVIAFKEKKN